MEPSVHPAKRPEETPLVIPETDDNSGSRTTCRNLLANGLDSPAPVFDATVLRKVPSGSALICEVTVVTT